MHLPMSPQMIVLLPNMDHHLLNLWLQFLCYLLAQRRQWHPIPVLLPGKSHGWRILVGCSPWCHLRVRHDWATSLSLFTFMHWRRQWQPTPVLLPGESQRQGSLGGCRLWVTQSRTRPKRLSSSSDCWPSATGFRFELQLLQGTSFLKSEYGLHRLQ